jgi:hypothetical protein
MGMGRTTALVLITLGYRRNAKKVLDGSVVEGEYLQSDVLVQPEQNVDKP